MCVMKDSWSLANCGAARSIKGLMGRPRLDSSSPYENQTHTSTTSVENPGKVKEVSRFAQQKMSHPKCFLYFKTFCLFAKRQKQHKNAGKMMYSGVVSGELGATSMCAIYDVSDDVDE